MHVLSIILLEYLKVNDINIFSKNKYTVWQMSIIWLCPASKMSLKTKRPCPPMISPRKQQRRLWNFLSNHINQWLPLFQEGWRRKIWLLQSCTQHTSTRCHIFSKNVCKLFCRPNYFTLKLESGTKMSQKLLNLEPSWNLLTNLLLDFWTKEDKSENSVDKSLNLYLKEYKS